MEKSVKSQKKQVVHLDIPARNTKVNDKSPFQIQEAYKYIRTNLLFALSTQESKVVVCSSSLPGEGKSTTCSNLAITMAQTGSNVLLIDADMRKPVQHKIFKKPNNAGLSNLLGGFYELSDVVVEGVEENLDLIPAGVIPPNPTELLSSDKMKDFIKRFSEFYDYVFIDTPPVSMVSDAVVLAGVASGVVLVTKQNVCTYDELQKAVESVQFSGAKILGFVLNGTEEKKHLYGRYRSYKYEYKED